MYIKIIAFTLSLFLLVATPAFSQEVLYFKKLAGLVTTSDSYSDLYPRIDSLKQTRRPNSSSLQVYLNRDVDFGFKHQRLKVTFNNVFYIVDFLLIQDKIAFSCTYFDKDFYADTYKNHVTVKIDTAVCLDYLNRRNRFYHSSKRLSDLPKELTSPEVFAFYCGDGAQETAKGKYIKDLVKNKKINPLTKLLQSISCEEQAYGLKGIEMLQSNRYNISPKVLIISKYLQERNSELSVCEGCLTGIVRKPKP